MANHKSQARDGETERLEERASIKPTIRLPANLMLLESMEPPPVPLIPIKKPYFALNSATQIQIPTKRGDPEDRKKTETESEPRRENFNYITNNWTVGSFTEAAAPLPLKRTHKHRNFPRAQINRR